MTDKGNKGNKGKCFFKVNRGQRKESDHYQTLYSMAEQFLEAHGRRIDFNKKVLEPAAGSNRAMVRVLMRWFRGFIEHYDLIEDGIDFLKHSKTSPYVITNPPFSLANQFIEKCMEVAEDGFVLLLPLNYLQGKKRYDQFFSPDCRKKFRLVLSNVYVFTRMPMLSDEVRDDGKYPAGMQSYAWYWWERPWHENSHPEIEWIDNNEYVLRKANR